MITLLHGDDTRKSRDALLSLRQAATGKEIRDIDGRSVDETTLTQSLSSSSLFGGDTVIVIEHMFSGLGKKIKRSQELAAMLVKEGNDVDIILWEDKEIGKTVTTALGSKTAVRLFKLPTIIFQFLDGCAPGQSKTLLTLYETLVAEEPPELVHAMLVKRVKTLLFLKSGKVPDGQQSWQLTRLTNQARAFTLERLQSLYKSLKTIEFNRNSGQSLFDVKEATELILIHL